MNMMPFWAAANLVTSSEVALPFKISLEDMASGTGRLVDGELSSYAGDGIRFRAGDVLFGKLRPYLAKYWLADREGTAGGDIHVYRPAPGIESRFLRYVVATSNFVRFAEAASKGTKMPRVEWAGLRTFPVMRVPLSAQQRIADFLDRETAEIDAMDVELDRLIGTLDERRRVTIDTILGVGPPSRLRWAIELSQTGPFGTQLAASEYVTGGIPVINPTHIRRDGIFPEESITVSNAKAVELERHLLKPGDIVLGRKGEVDKSALVSDSLGPALCGSDSMLIRADRDKCSPEYLWWFFQSANCHTQLERMSVGTTVAGLNQTAISALWMPLPEAAEQHRIVAELDEQTVRIDSMIADAQRLKALLAERRTTLITDVVTGRKEVA